MRMLKIVKKSTHYNPLIEDLKRLAQFFKNNPKIAAYKNEKQAVKKALEGTGLNAQYYITENYTRGYSVQSRNRDYETFLYSDKTDIETTIGKRIEYFEGERAMRDAGKACLSDHNILREVSQGFQYNRTEVTEADIKATTQRLRELADLIEYKFNEALEVGEIDVDEVKYYKV